MIINDTTAIATSAAAATTTTMKIFTHSCCYNIVMQMEGVGPYYKHSVENTQKGHQQLYKNIYCISGSHSIE